MGEPEEPEEWQTGKPPNEVLVEVECNDEIIQVKAFHGRDGYLPHWQTEDGGKVWGVNTFTRWREI